MQFVQIVSNTSKVLKFILMMVWLEKVSKSVIQMHKVHVGVVSLSVEKTKYNIFCVLLNSLQFVGSEEGWSFTDELGLRAKWNEGRQRFLDWMANCS